MEKDQAVFSEEEVKKFFDVLNRYNVEQCELRRIGNNKKTLIQKVETNTGDIQLVLDFIKANKLERETVNCTFNKMSSKGSKSTNAVTDGEIEQVNFLFIDIDSKKAAKGQSATDKELASSELLMVKLSEFLDNNRINKQIKIMSGNGYHLLIPIDVENVKSAVEINKTILKILNAKFSNENAKVDKGVFNPSRLGKLVGTVASKGTSTPERPHRVSRIISTPNDSVAISEEVLKKFINDHEEILGNVTQGEVGMTFTEASSNYSTQPIDVRLWLDSHGLTYRVKDGDVKGFEIFVLSNCPFKDHSTNSNGTSLIVNPEKKVKFNCLHDSHAEININHFIDKYSIPERAILNRVTEERLKNNQSFFFENFELNQQGIFIKKKNSTIKIASPMYISSVYQLEDVNTMSYDLKYISNGEWCEKHITGDQLQLSKFKGLVEYGLEFKTRYESDVIDFLQMQKQTLTSTLLHQEVGFKERDGELVYLLNDSIAESENTKKSVIVKNAYNNLSEKEYLLWKELIEVFDNNSAISLGLSIGLVPFLIGFLSKKEGAIPNLIINLRGKSSSGKTTILNLIGSIYGEPKSMVLTMNATQNSLIHITTKNNGVPLLLDELGAMQSNFNLDQLIFTLSSGQERLRLTKDIDLRKQETFSTGTIITSESGLDKHLSNITGLYMRYLEFCDIPWCDSGEDAELISEAVRLSYGGLVRVIANYVLINQELVVSWYKKSITDLNYMISENHKLKSRLIKNIALVHLGAKLLGNVGYQVDMDYINNALIESYNHMLDLADKPEEDIYLLICEEIISNASRFANDNNSVVRNGRCLGRVKISKEKLIVNVFKNTFVQMLIKMGFPDEKAVLSKLIEGNKLNSDKNRLTKRIRSKEGIIPTYQIELPIDSKVYFGLGAETGVVPSLSPSINLLNTMSEKNAMMGLLTEEELF